jgi:hypothetical protein
MFLKPLTGEEGGLESMAKKVETAKVVKGPTQLRVSRDEAKIRLQSRMEKGLELKRTQVGTAEALEGLNR